MLGKPTAWLGVLALALAPQAGAQSTLRVATKESPPFAFRDPAGVWVGISVDLWEALAERLALDYQLVEAETTTELLEGVERGEFDAAVAAITVTAERESGVDFTHPYFTTGLGVAVRGEAGTGVARILRGVLSWPFLTLLGSVLLGLLVSGYLFWIVERRRNKTFQEGHRSGVSQGLWWSTIMLFGHKGIYPTSTAGRVLAATSMLVSILLLSVLTGAIASALTVGHFEVLIRDPNDLRHVRALAVEGSSSAGYLRRQRIAYESVSSVPAGLTAVAEGRGDALVHDAPLLEFEVARLHVGGLHVLPQTFELQDYAVAVGQGSPLRERLNTALLELRASPRWEEIQYRYLRR